MPEITPEIILSQDEPAWFRGLGLLFACTLVPKVAEGTPGGQAGRTPSLVREAQAAHLQAGRRYEERSRGQGGPFVEGETEVQ